MTDLVSITSAPRRLTELGDKISRQGLAKHCAKHDLRIDTPDGPRVDFDRVRAHRETNYGRKVMSGGVKVSGLVPPANVAALFSPPPSPLSSPAGPDGAQGKGGGHDCAGVEDGEVQQWLILRSFT